MKPITTVAVLAAALVTAAVVLPQERGTWTLYRTSAFGEPESVLYDPAARRTDPIHVATFDSSEGNDYNRTNCEIARDLFQSQPGVVVNYWCEPR